MTMSLVSDVNLGAMPTRYSTFFNLFCLVQDFGWHETPAISDSGPDRHPQLSPMQSEAVWEPGI